MSLNIKQAMNLKSKDYLPVIFSMYFVKIHVGTRAFLSTQSLLPFFTIYELPQIFTDICAFLQMFCGENA